MEKAQEMEVMPSFPSQQASALIMALSLPSKPQQVRSAWQAVD